MEPLPPSELVVTTSHKARSAAIARAEEFAREWSYPYRARGDQPFEEIIGRGDAALVFTNSELRLATRSGSLTSHLGTAHIRLKSLSRCEGDPLVRAGDLQPGDRVIDTTFGLGRDAVVAALAIGQQGAVTALESSPALFHLGQHGLTAGALTPSQVAFTAEALPAPMDLVHADARVWLAEQRDDSADVVLVDPMFETPKTSDSGFEVLRSVADPTPLDAQWIAEARRVCRRWVVVKSGPEAPWFTSAGLERLPGHSNANWWRAEPS